MSVKTTLSPDGSEITLHISGRFDFSTHQNFVSGYKVYKKGEKAFIVDLKSADYMDSSAMGMLLQLREYGKADGGVKLINANDGIREILRIANFDKLFAIA